MLNARSLALERLWRGRAPPPLPAPAPAAVEAFVDTARQCFIAVQQAWDRADLVALAAIATEPLFQELQRQLAARGAAANHTEVLQVQARLLKLEDLRDGQLACVEFCGLVREQPGAPPAEFRELWLLARLPQDAAWRVARVQALA